MPRELLVAVRGELRALTGHWAQGFTAGGEPLVTHDRRMPDGGCLPCHLLAVLDAALHPGHPSLPERDAVTEVVNLGSRRRARTSPSGRRP